MNLQVYIFKHGTPSDVLFFTFVPIAFTNEKLYTYIDEIECSLLSYEIELLLINLSWSYSNKKVYFLKLDWQTTTVKMFVCCHAFIVSLIKCTISLNIFVLSQDLFVNINANILAAKSQTSTNGNSCGHFLIIGLSGYILWFHYRSFKHCYAHYRCTLDVLFRLK